MERIDDFKFEINLEEETFLNSGCEATSKVLQQPIKYEEIKIEECEDGDLESIICDELVDIGLGQIKAEEHENCNSRNNLKQVNSEQPLKTMNNNRYLTRKINAINKRIKSFECNKCNYKGTQRSALTKHMNATHMRGDKKPFQCNECDYNAATKRTLTTHVNAIHKELKTFECNKNSKQVDLSKSHRKMKKPSHPNLPEVNVTPINEKVGIENLTVEFGSASEEVTQIVILDECLFKDLEESRAETPQNVNVTPINEKVGIENLTVEFGSVSEEVTQNAILDEQLVESDLGSDFDNSLKELSVLNNGQANINFQQDGNLYDQLCNLPSRKNDLKQPLANYQAHNLETAGIDNSSFLSAPRSFENQNPLIIKVKLSNANGIFNDAIGKLFELQFLNDEMVLTERLDILSPIITRKGNDILASNVPSAEIMRLSTEPQSQDVGQSEQEIVNPVIYGNRKGCPVEHCKASVKQLSVHLNSHPELSQDEIKELCRQQRKRPVRKPINENVIDYRKPKLCPLEECKKDAPYFRLDHHLRNFHKMDPNSDQYRSIVRKRNDASQLTGTSKKLKVLYSPIAIKYSEEFYEYLVNFTGGQSTPIVAKCQAGEIRKILNCLCQEDINNLNSRTTIKKIEEWFQSYDEVHKGSSSSVYGSTFLKFLRFFKLSYPTLFSSEDLRHYELLLSGWKKCFSKHTRMDESEKGDIELVVTDIEKFENSAYSLKIVNQINNLDPTDKNNNRNLHTSIRDFICLNLLFWNAARSGCICNMTEAEYNRGVYHEAEEMYTVQVRRHKTVREHGSAGISFPMDIKSWIDKYMSCARPTLEKVIMNHKLDVPVFVTWSGKSLSSSDLNMGIKSTWGNAGLSAKIGSTLLRHIAVDEVHQFGSEQEKHDFADKMCHRFTTAVKNYKSKQKSLVSANSSKKIHKAMCGEMRISNRNHEINEQHDVLSQLEHEEPSYFDQSTSSSATLEKGLNAPGKGNNTFTEEERKKIRKAFTHQINDNRVPARKIIREIIREKKLDYFIGQHATVPSVWGCLQGIVNKQKRTKQSNILSKKKCKY